MKHNKLLGFSACAVAKALGRFGVKFDEADRIMKSHGITMPKASLGGSSASGAIRKAGSATASPRA